MFSWYMLFNYILHSVRPSVLFHTDKLVCKICIFNKRLLNISRIHSKFLLAWSFGQRFSYALLEGYIQTLLSLWCIKAKKETNRKRWSSVGIIFGYWIDNRKIVVRFPAEEDLLLAHPVASCSMLARCPFERGKTAGGQSCYLTSI
jgi:hypothetical protein